MLYLRFQLSQFCTKMFSGNVTFFLIRVSQSKLLRELECTTFYTVLCLHNPQNSLKTEQMFASQPK